MPAAPPPPAPSGPGPAGRAPRRPGRPVSPGAPEEQRNRLLDAAAERFARQGFDGASLRDIAAAAGLSHAMIRHLVGTKEALWMAAADHLFQKMRKALFEALTGVDAGDPEQRMEAQVRASVRTAAKVPSLAGFVMQAGLAGGERYQTLVERHLAPLHAVALEPYRQLVAEGRAESLEPHYIFLVATNATVSAFAQAANTRALAGFELSDPDRAEAYAGAIITILKHGLLRDRSAAGDAGTEAGAGAAGLSGGDSR